MDSRKIRHKSNHSKSMKCSLSKKSAFVLSIATALMVASCGLTLTPTQSLSLRQAASNVMPGGSVVAVSTEHSSVVLAAHLTDRQLAGESITSTTNSVRHRSARLIQSAVRQGPLPGGTEYIVVRTYHGLTVETSAKLLYEVEIPIRAAIAGVDDLDVIKAAMAVQVDAIPEVLVIVR